MAFDVNADSSMIGNDVEISKAEERAAHVGGGLAIRDDGVLVPATPAILRLPNVKPYHGDPAWTLAQRLDWLAGRTVRGTERAAAQQGLPEAPRVPAFQELKAKEIRSALAGVVKKSA